MKSELERKLQLAELQITKQKFKIEMLQAQVRVRNEELSHLKAAADFLRWAERWMKEPRTDAS
ncbi:MAG: hypothetical protein ACRD2A_05270 [Vicinamibacterales bacterium]